MHPEVRGGRDPREGRGRGSSGQGLWGAAGAEAEAAGDAGVEGPVRAVKDGRGALLPFISPSEGQDTLAKALGISPARRRYLRPRPG